MARIRRSAGVALSGADAEHARASRRRLPRAPTKSRCSSRRRRRSRSRTSTARSPRASSARSRSSTRRSAHGVRVRGYISCRARLPVRRRGRRRRAWRDVAAALHAMGCYEVSLGDTIGAGTPGKTQALLATRRRARCRSTALAGHFHDTYGQALANIYAALRGRRRDVRLLGRRARRLPVREGRDRQRRERGRAVPARRPRHRDRRRHDAAARRRPLHLRFPRARAGVARGARARRAEALGRAASAVARRRA